MSELKVSPTELGQKHTLSCVLLLQTRCTLRSEKNKPLLPLNLSYLFTSYGDEQALGFQPLFSQVMTRLHANPWLPSKDISNAIKNNTDPQGSLIAQQVKHVECVTLTQLSLNLEELSKIWSVFFRVPYAMSMAYLASTIMIVPEKSDKKKFFIGKIFPFIKKRASTLRGICPTWKRYHF